MKIKTILTEQIDYTMDQIERYLCINQISYVRVDNEIHCQDLIIRFFDFEKDKREIRAGLLEIFEKESQNREFKKASTDMGLEFEKPSPWYLPKQNKRKMLKISNQKTKKYI